jgi:uncharacterized membrane protein HdeD (DUF308 family)
MSSSAASPQFGRPAAYAGMSETDESARLMTRLWWLWLVTGTAWIVASLVILQFDQASITTVGIIIGIMFSFAALQQFVYAAFDARHRWLWALFGVLFAAAAVVAFINPEETFAGLADISGFLFLLVGVWWMIRAFLDRGTATVWWLGLIAGMLMVVLAFWTSGQFFIEKAYTLLVFAGIWALMQGIIHICAGFAVRAMRDEMRDERSALVTPASLDRA